MIAIPKHDKAITLFAEWDGVKCYAWLDSRQKWSCKKSGKYFLVTRKGSAICLRLTPRAFDQNFVLTDYGG